jgi:hypothetical protein
MTEIYTCICSDFTGIRRAVIFSCLDYAHKPLDGVALGQTNNFGMDGEDQRKLIRYTCIVETNLQYVKSKIGLNRSRSLVTADPATERSLAAFLVLLVGPFGLCTL